MQICTVLDVRKYIEMIISGMTKKSTGKFCYNQYMTLPLGKLSPDRLSQLLNLIASTDPSVVLGPGVGRDCAVIDLGGDQLLVAKSDPITFATDEIGWYAVHVNANDLATTGATPRWFLATALLPEGHTTEKMLTTISEQLFSACRELGIPNEERTHQLEALKSRRLPLRFRYRCPVCERDYPRARPICRPLACGPCCEQRNGGRYDARFRLVAA